VVSREDSGVRRVVARCRRGLDGPDLPADLQQLLAQIAHFDMACWGLLDPGTLWPVTNAGTSAATGAAAVRAWQYELTTPDVLKVTDLAAGHPTGVLSIATGGEPDRSPRYRSVLAPVGVTDELRVLLNTGGVSWGWMALFRLGGVFTPLDAARIAALQPHLARAWRNAVLRTAAKHTTDPTPPAVVVLDRDDRIESLTPGGQALLQRLPADRAGPIPGVLRALASRARAHTSEEDCADGVRAMLPDTDGRWLLLDAAPLLGTSRSVAITARQADRVDVGAVLLRAHGLTPRETEVALAVLRNETTKQIAATLNLSPWTVQDHLKAAFAKTGVRSRRELAVHLFRPPPHTPDPPPR
jgi:DNA-binding CsgD family transcriptional regulator